MLPIAHGVAEAGTSAVIARAGTRSAEETSTARALGGTRCFAVHLHAQGRDGPNTSVRVDLVRRRHPHLARPRRRQRQELERRTDGRCRLRVLRPAAPGGCYGSGRSARRQLPASLVAAPGHGVAVLARRHVVVVDAAAVFRTSFHNGCRHRPPTSTGTGNHGARVRAGLDPVFPEPSRREKCTLSDPGWTESETRCPVAVGAGSLTARAGVAQGTSTGFGASPRAIWVSLQATVKIGLDASRSLERRDPAYGVRRSSGVSGLVAGTGTLRGQELGRVSWLSSSVAGGALRRLCGGRPRTGACSRAGSWFPSAGEPAVERQLEAAELPGAGHGTAGPATRRRPPRPGPDRRAGVTGTQGGVAGVRVRPEVVRGSPGRAVSRGGRAGRKSLPPRGRRRSADGRWTVPVAVGSVIGFVRGGVMAGRFARCRGRRPSPWALILRGNCCPGEAVPISCSGMVVESVPPSGR